MIALDDLLLATGGTLLGDAPASHFERFAFDSRRVQPGDLFIAVQSERGDGHDYVQAACAAGATGLMVQRPVAVEGCAVTVVCVPETQAALHQWGGWVVRRYATEVVGVTGSTGKTTTKEAITHLLAPFFRTFKNPGNWNGRYGLPLALGQLRPEHELAVLEMASDSLGEIADLAALAPPTVAVVTTVQPAHLDVFGSLERIAQEKGDLVRALPPHGLALLNGDDPRVRAMAALSRAPVRLFGTSEGCALRAQEVRLSSEGTRFTLHAAGAAARAVAVPLLGAHQLYPVLAAVGVALHYGLPLDELVPLLATLPRVPGRLNPLPGRNGSLVIDDSYNASPSAMHAALALLAALPARRRVALLGEMHELGDFAPQAYRAIGEQAARVADRLVCKGEAAGQIAAAAEAAGLARHAIAVTHTTEDAVRAASAGLGAGDVLLVKGGMAARMERVVAQLLADSGAAARALVRQEAAWQQVASTPLDRPTWIEIALEAIADNARTLKALVGPTVALMAVVKADGYGHGAVQVARTALNNGASWLGVACLPEAEALRAAAIRAPILVLGYTPPWQARAALRHDLRVTLFSEEVARALSRAARALGRTARVHVKVDTGMHRLGLFPDQVLPLLRTIAELPGLAVEGLFTHFSVADSGAPDHMAYTRWQLGRFQALLDQLAAEGIAPPIVHAANSAATIALPEARFNMVRPGIALYGLAPSPEVALPPGLRPALAWKTQIAQVKRLPPGSLVSYGATYRTEGEQRIAVIPVGYADGFRRAPTTWGELLVRGQRAPLVGRVCMDQCMIDVTAIPGVRAGDEVVLIGTQGAATLSAEQVATRLGTIPYEVVSEILARVPRVGG